MAKPAQCLPFPLISTYWKQAAWRKGEGWSLWGPHWGWGSVIKSLGYVFWWVWRKECGRENRQMADTSPRFLCCHLVSSPFLMEPPIPSSEPFFTHQLQPPWVSTSPPASLSLSYQYELLWSGQGVSPNCPSDSDGDLVWFSSVECDWKLN